MAEKNRSYEKSHLTPAIGDYLVGLFAPETPGLRDAARAIESSGMPQIQVSPWDGRILEILLRLVGAHKVVELGTLGAYSTQWIARALPPDGRLWTVEASPRHAEVARGVLERAGLSDRVVVREGKGLDVLPTLERHGPFDAVFVDADKGGYAAYYGELLPSVRTGGLLLVDNTLWSGRVVDETADDPDTLAIRAFNDLVAGDERVESYLLPIGDGLTLIRKR